MRDTWHVWQRAMGAGPVLSLAVAALAAINTGLLVGNSLLVSKAVGAVAAGHGGGALVTPLLTLGAALICTGLTAVVLRPLCLRLERAVVVQQIDDLMRKVQAAETSGTSADSLRQLGATAERVVSMPHHDALGSLADLLRTRCRGVAGIVVVALISPVAAVVVALCAVAYGVTFTNFLDDVLAGLASKGPLETRRAKYVRSLHFDHGIAGELRTFGAIPWLLRTFADLSASGRAQSSRARQRHARSVVVAAFACTAALLGCFAWLITRAWHGGLSIAELTLGIQGALLMLELGPAGDVAVRFRRVVQVERDIAERLPTAMPASAPPGSVGPDAAVVCRSIRHFYPGSERPALEVEELTIRMGERVAVVGRNGAGKSTLFGVVAGYLQPTEGSVARGSETVSVALQRSARYPATLRENVNLGEPTVDVDRALASVGQETTDMIGARLEEQLGAPGTDAGNLSGGQWQRVGLARAFGRDAGGVLLLDEPSAALDPAAEAEFFRTAMERAEGRTILLSTHHLANIRFAERIIVLDGGRIVEDGTHASLMAARGLYAEMFVAQARTYGVEL